MGIFDKAKDAISEHGGKVDEVIAKVGDVVDEKTGHQYSDKIDQGEELASDRIGDYAGSPDAGSEPGTDPRPA